METNELLNWVHKIGFSMLRYHFSSSFQTAWMLLKRERCVNLTPIKSAKDLWIIFGKKKFYTKTC